MSVTRRVSATLTSNMLSMVLAGGRVGDGVHRVGPDRPARSRVGHRARLRRGRRGRDTGQRGHNGRREQQDDGTDDGPDHGTRSFFDRARPHSASPLAYDVATST